MSPLVLSLLMSLHPHPAPLPQGRGSLEMFYELKVKKL